MSRIQSQNYAGFQKINSGYFIKCYVVKIIRDNFVLSTVLHVTMAEK